MQYDERMIAPMRAELTRLGLEELRTAAQVDAALKDQPGTRLVVVNSVCGCAARNMRPAVALAMRHGALPDHAFTVFAGGDVDDAAGAHLFHRLRAELAEHRAPARREAGAHDRALADRGADGGGDRRGPHEGVRRALRGGDAVTNPAARVTE